ncbi:S-layer homology domain-containing protein, partial [Oscillibacter sp. MSJ-31]|uniref:S-layer homology domain-containing protein n=1 Tax=Oscillibacter sp. MSJ-31 TaxID=2841526 RepID=UPI001C115A27
QLATILAKLLKLPAAKDAGFTDNTADAWYYDAINRCAAAGILNGNGDGTVTPEAPISRERAMVMLARALGIEPIREPDLTKYTDAAKVAPYAQGMVAAMIEAGIVGGVTADELAPQDNINRASTVTILDRAISTYADKAGATVKADGKGIVLVVADDVTVTGNVDKLLVPADNVDVTVSGSKNIDDITVTGDNSKVILNNSTANDVTLDGKNTELETKSGSKVENVSVTEDAKGATVNAGSGTTVKNVENSAADTTVTGSGSVKNVASDKDMTVETKNTEVKNTGDEKISVTDKNGKTTETTAGGSSTTTGGSSGSSSGGGSSHSYNIYKTDWDTMLTVSECSCGATQAVENSSTYYVSNDTQLKAFRNMVNNGNSFAGKTVKLTADINLNNDAWTPIGTSTTPFSGEFDGAGKSITGLEITGAGENLGLFGYVESTVNIHDFTIAVNIDSTGKKIGAVVGAAAGNTRLTLSNIIVCGTVKGDDKVGGLVGQAPQYSAPTAGYEPLISFENCENKAAVTGMRAGGILSSGLNARGRASFVNCVNRGTITDAAASNGYIAGIVGQVNAPGLGVAAGSNEAVAAYKTRYNANTFLTIRGCSNEGTLVPSTGGTAYTLLNTSYSCMDGTNGATAVKTQRGLVLEVYMLSRYEGNSPYESNGESYGVKWKETDSENKWLQGYAYDTDTPYAVMLNNGTKFTQDQFNTDDAAEKNVTINSEVYYAGVNEIKLLSDLTWNKSFSVEGSGKDITVDLNGKTLTAARTLFTNNVCRITFKNGTIIMVDGCDVLISGCSNVTFENDVILNAGGKTILWLDGTGGSEMGSSTFGTGVSGKIEVANAAAAEVTFNGTTYNWNTEGGTMGTYTVTNGVVTKDATA